MPNGRDVKNPYVRFKPLKKPPLTPMVTTLWDYPSQHYGDREQGSQKYRGATPSWVIWQVIQRFTTEGGVVVDPFCGSGTTLDVARDLGRRGVGFDIAPTRDDIERADARSLPLDDDSVDLGFMDPPYADNLTYSDDAACIGRLRADDGSWHDAMEQVLAELARVIRPGGHLGIYVADVRKRSGAFHSLGLDLAAMGRTHFRLIDHVSVVRRNRDLEKGNYRKAAAEGGFLLRGFNHLLLFELPDIPRVVAAPNSSGRGVRRGRAPGQKKNGPRPPGGRAQQQKPKRR